MINSPLFPLELLTKTRYLLFFRGYRKNSLLNRQKSISLGSGIGKKVSACFRVILLK